MKLLLGAASKIDEDGLLVTADRRRPLASPGLDLSYLYHVGSFPIAGVLNATADLGDRGPTYWDGMTWGLHRGLPKVPKLLVIAYLDPAGFAARITPIFEDTFASIGVSVALAQSCQHEEFSAYWPILLAAPIGDMTLIDQGSFYKNNLFVPQLIDTSLYRGGEVYVATVTETRVTWISGNALAVNEDDYTFGGNVLADPVLPGYDAYHFSSTHGFIVARADALDHLDKLSQAAPKFRKFRNVFYQSTFETVGTDPINGPYDSSIVPDSAMDELIGGGSENIARVSYDPFAGIPALFDRIVADALDFFG